MSGNLDLGRNELKCFGSHPIMLLSLIDLSKIGDDGSGREYLMERNTPDLLCSCVVVVFEEVEEVSVYNITVQGLSGDDDFLNSAAGHCIDSDSEDDDLVGYWSEVGWSESSGSGLSMHYTDSIEDLVGRDWLIHEGWVASLE
ncbi:hypothetical protein FIBSPDRAFT_897796 [Athelia psychrophila]|uniref:Uncharacterized protein n=1 Tax=Athelia psychrophila TaxID=1759441 RepID=A0A166BRQ1_9AGAM|nr:hypothetical protein FIBSPDRAFT_897796 [Fibularhizoctonia sp. CBS 109695]